MFFNEEAGLDNIKLDSGLICTNSKFLVSVLMVWLGEVEHVI